MQTIIRSYWFEHDLVQLIRDELEPNDIAFILPPCLVLGMFWTHKKITLLQS